LLRAKYGSAIIYKNDRQCDKKLKSGAKITIMVLMTALGISVNQNGLIASYLLYLINKPQVDNIPMLK